MLIPLAVLAGFAAALGAPALAARVPRAAGWLLGLLAAVLAACFLSLAPAAVAGSPHTAALPWAEALGVSLQFRADGLSLLFALLISGIGALILIYAGGYLKGRRDLGRFNGWLLAFMAAMLGVVLADNLLLLFVFWELTSLTSYMLIGFEHDEEVSRKSALQALLVTGGGGLALLAGLVLLGQAAGTYQLSLLAARGGALPAGPLYVPALLLILAGAFTKSAQFPFHFWLPNAMAAPTPVSAYLHSATMVKAGIYLLARLSPALGGTDLWLYLVGGAGAATMLAGGYLALLQTDLKRLLAYSTVSALGLITLLIGLGTAHALEAAVILVLAHALYKGALFLVAGAIDHETGTRDVAVLGGLFPKMRLTALGAGLAGLSMAGFPPLFGFISKEETYAAALDAPYGPLAAGAALAAGLSFVVVAGAVGLGPFAGPARKLPKDPHEAPASMLLGPLVLGALGLLFGLLPNALVSPLLSAAASAALGEAVALKLSLWHGVNTPLILSAITLAAGAGLYAARGLLRAGLGRLAWPWGPAYFYERALDLLNFTARLQTRLLQNGYLRLYLMAIVLTTVALAGSSLVLRGGLRWAGAIGEVRFYDAALAVLIVAAAFVATVSPSRLGAVAALGAAGYGVALIYMVFGAPDLAMTQVLIESLTVILFVLAFYHLPRFTRLTSGRERARDVVVALLGGGLMTVLLLAAAGWERYASVTQYYVDNALPLAHGRNIVNVILVDFRSLDTLGEITVLGIAAVGVFALLKMGSRRRKEG